MQSNWSGRPTEAIQMHGSLDSTNLGHHSLSRREIVRMKALLRSTAGVTKPKPRPYEAVAFHLGRPRLSRLFSPPPNSPHQNSDWMLRIYFHTTLCFLSIVSSNEVALWHWMISTSGSGLMVVVAHLSWCRLRCFSLELLWWVTLYANDWRIGIS